MGFIEGGCNVDMEEVNRLVKEALLWLGIGMVILILLCVICVLLIRRWRRKCRNSATPVVKQSVSVEDITLDLTEQTQELRKYADEVHTLVDIGYYSVTEVIE